MSDRRIKKTKSQLRAGLTKLLKEKSIKEITVKELVNEVDINRSTFYLHYNDVYDLLNKIENELFEEFLYVTEKHKDEYTGNFDPSYLVDVFEVLAKNIDIVSVLLGPHGDISFLNKIKHMISDKIIDNMKNISNNYHHRDIEYTFSFYLNGCIGLVEHWIQTGLKDSPEHLANLCFELIGNGIRSYINQARF